VERMARAARHELRPRPRLRRRGRRCAYPSCRRNQRTSRDLGCRPSPRQVHFRTYADGDPRPQCRAGAPGMFSGLAGVDWTRLRRSHLVRPRGCHRSVLIVVNATLAGAAAMLAVAAITRIRFGKPDASLCANGWVSGLVASSAGCAVMPPAAAMIVGLIAGALVTYTVELLELHLTIDDPGGSISVHLIGGLWGVLAVAWPGRFPEGSASGQWLAQLAGVASLLGFVLPLTLRPGAPGKPLLPHAGGARRRAARTGSA